MAEGWGGWGRNLDGRTGSGRETWSPRRLFVCLLACGGRAACDHGRFLAEWRTKTTLGCRGQRSGRGRTGLGDAGEPGPIGMMVVMVKVGMMVMVMKKRERSSNSYLVGSSVFLRTCLFPAVFREEGGRNSSIGREGKRKKGLADYPTPPSSPTSYSLSVSLPFPFPLLPVFPSPSFPSFSLLPLFLPLFPGGRGFVRHPPRSRLPLVSGAFMDAALAGPGRRGRRRGPA